MTITKTQRNVNTIWYYNKEYHTIQSRKKTRVISREKNFAEEGRKIREIFEEFDDEDDGNKTIH